jgi:hypothetical protein
VLLIGVIKKPLGVPVPIHGSSKRLFLFPARDRTVRVSKDAEYGSPQE